jgi:hypothetical protein
VALTSLFLGLLSLTALVIRLLTNLEPSVWLVMVLTLAGLFTGINAVTKQVYRFVAWIGVTSSSVALVTMSIVYGIGHGLR